MRSPSFLALSVLLGLILVGFEFQKWAVCVRPTTLRSLDAFSYGLVPLIVLIATLAAVSIMFRGRMVSVRSTAVFGIVCWLLLGVGQTIMVFGQRVGLRPVELMTQLAALAACCVATCLVALAWTSRPRDGWVASGRPPS